MLSSNSSESTSLDAQLGKGVSGGFRALRRHRPRGVFNHVGFKVVADRALGAETHAPIKSQTSQETSFNTRLMQHIGKAGRPHQVVFKRAVRIASRIRAFLENIGKLGTHKSGMEFGFGRAFKTVIGPKRLRFDLGQ